MTPHQLVKELLKREGKRKQVDRAQMLETIGHLSDMIYEEWAAQPEGTWLQIGDCLYTLGEKRAKKRKK